MSKVISFRLDENNPREARALSILETRQKEGYSTRRIITEALLSTEGDDPLKTMIPDELQDMIDLLGVLVERNGSNDHTPGNPEKSMEEACLSNQFIASIKQNAKPGVEIG